MKIFRILAKLSNFIVSERTNDELIKRFWGFLNREFSKPAEKTILENYRKNPPKYEEALTILILDKTRTNLGFKIRLEEFKSLTLPNRVSKGNRPHISRSISNTHPAPSVTEGDVTGRYARMAPPPSYDKFPKVAKKKKASKKAVHKASKKASKKKSVSIRTTISRKQFVKKAVAKKTPKIKEPILKAAKNVSNDTCNAKVEMERQISPVKPALVQVTISREELFVSKKTVGQTTNFLSMPGKQLRITLRSVLNFTVQGEDTVLIDLPEPKSPEILTFKIVPAQIGKCTLAVDLWQEQALLASLKVTTTCIANRRSSRKVVMRAKSIQNANYPQLFNQLIISEDQVGNNYYYDYRLQIPALQIHHKFRSPAINGNREKYINGLYNEIERLWDTSAENATQFRNELNNFGTELFDQLFPRDLQEMLYNNQDEINSIQVMSEEPFIPWELVLLKRPGPQHRWKTTDKYLGQLGVTRWLWNSYATDKLFIRNGRVRYVIPEYFTEELQLPAAPIEKAYLEKTFNAVGVPPDPLKVDSFIRKAGTYDVLHFCCHGINENRNSVNAKLLMREKKKAGKLVPTYLTQKSIQSCGMISKRDTRPIIVLNACQSGIIGNGIARYNGFASAFLQAGAGAFVGSLWSVEDKPAVTFIKTLYESLRKGQTLAEATVNAREVARKEKDASWISYVVYGNPFATISNK